MDLADRPKSDNANAIGLHGARSTRDLLHQAKTSRSDQAIQGRGEQFGIAGAKVREQPRIYAYFRGQFLNRTPRLSNRTSKISQETFLPCGSLDFPIVLDVPLAIGQFLLNCGLPFGSLLRSHAQFNSLLSGDACSIELCVLFRC